MHQIDLERFVQQLVAAPERWAAHVFHSATERICHQICDDLDVNAWLICWDQDQDTGFHDHDESSAAIAVISGQVREDRLRLGQAPRSRVLGSGPVFTVPSVAIHRVLHAGTAPAVTLHAYSPPLIRTGAYRIGPDGELERELLSGAAELHATPAFG